MVKYGDTYICVYMYYKSLPKYLQNDEFAGSKLVKAEYDGLGMIHKNLCTKPFSTACGFSITDFATVGCVNPPIVSPVLFM